MTYSNIFYIRLRGLTYDLQIGVTYILLCNDRLRRRAPHIFGAAVQIIGATHLISLNRKQIVSLDLDTVKVLNFRTSIMIAVINLKFKQRGFSIEKFIQNVKIE